MSCISTITTSVFFVKTSINCCSKSHPLRQIIGIVYEKESCRPALAVNKQVGWGGGGSCVLLFTASPKASAKNLIAKV